MTNNSLLLDNLNLLILVFFIAISESSHALYLLFYNGVKL